jgi:hypothetical protein
MTHDGKESKQECLSASQQAAKGAMMNLLQSKNSKEK